MRPLVVIVVLFAGYARSLFGHGEHIHMDEAIAFDRPEAWGMRYFAAVALMQGDGPPPELEKGQFALGVDVIHIPRLSKEERTIGFQGTKEENLNKSPLLARPLIHYGITDRLSVTGTFVPPVEVVDRLKTYMAGLSVNYVVYRTDRFDVSLRAMGQWTEAQGDFTCAEEIAGDPDPIRNPYQCEFPSNDTFTSVTASVEGKLEYYLSPRWSLFIAAMYSYADLKFQADAYYGGLHDTGKLTTDGNIWSFGAGIRYRLSEDLSMGLMLAHTPLNIRRPPEFRRSDEDLTHLRLSINLRL